MTAQSDSDLEPKPAQGAVVFEEGDLYALSEGLCRDAQYNDRRLALRQKLGALAKEFVAFPRRPKLGLASRTSLHNPHAFNGNRVKRLWAYICRDKMEKNRLKKVVGADIAKDLDASFRNAYFCLAMEAEKVEVSVRIHPDAWLDGQNLKRRVDKEGMDELLSILNELDGYFLRLADWKGEWRCGQLNTAKLKEFFGYYKPGEHALALERNWPAPKSQPAVRSALFGEGVGAMLLEDMRRLEPFYQFAAWSKQSDHIFG
ncbi:MAG: hypothetical protein ACI8X5_001573 [Planctomycetota bacterium]|jgi:hypothetical protein